MHYNKHQISNAISYVPNYAPSAKALVQSETTNFSIGIHAVSMLVVQRKKENHCMKL